MRKHSQARPRMLFCVAGTDGISELVHSSDTPDDPELLPKSAFRFLHTKTDLGRRFAVSTGLLCRRERLVGPHHLAPVTVNNSVCIIAQRAGRALSRRWASHRPSPPSARRCVLARG